MQNKEEQKKILWGALIGGAVGASVWFLWHTLHSDRKNVLHRMGEAMSEIGEILEEGKTEDSKGAFRTIRENLPHGEEHPLNRILSVVATGLQVWNQIKKGEK